MLPWQIQFGLFPFRSPLLGKSLLIFFPRGTQMLHFPRFDLHYHCNGVCLRIGFQFGHPRINGRLHLPWAYRSLPRPSSLLKPSHPPTGVSTPAYSVIILHDYTRRSSLVHGGTSFVLPQAISCRGAFFVEEMCIPTPFTNLCSKEVIRPQVPLRSPCYDFSLVARLVFDNAN